MKEPKTIVYYDFDKKIIHKTSMLEDDLTSQEVFPSNYVMDDFIYTFINWDYKVKSENLIEAYPIYKKEKNYLIFDKDFNVEGILNNYPSLIIIPEYYVKERKVITIKKINDNTFSKKECVCAFWIPKTIEDINAKMLEFYMHFIVMFEHNEESKFFQDKFDALNSTQIKSGCYFDIQKKDLKIIDDVVYILKNNEVILAKYLNKNENYIIPKIVEFNKHTYDVTIIGSRAFSLSNIECVTLPLTIKTIKAYAFQGSRKLRQVKFDKNINLKEIHNCAFAFCPKLKDLYIPKCIEVMGKRVFYHSDTCIIYLEDENKVSWSDDWYSNCKCYSHVSYEQLIDKDGLRYLLLEDYAILACCYEKKENINVLESIEFNNKTYEVRHIGDFAFASTDIISVTIPKSIETIKHCAFSYCDLLKNVIFADDSNLTYIGSKAFSDCKSLKTISLPQKLEKITSLAFASCKNLETVFINSDADVVEESFWFSPKFVLYFSNEKKSLPSEQKKFISSRKKERKIIIDDNDSYVPNKDNIILKKDKSIPIYDNINEHNIFITRDFIFVIKNNEAILTKYIGMDTNVKIPSSIIFANKEYKVSTIGTRAFMNDTIQTIVIPYSVLKINEFAITDNKELKAIYCDAPFPLKEWDNLWIDKKSIVQFNYQRLLMK